MEQEPIIITEDIHALGLLVFCYTCNKTLYHTNDKNPTTQMVADMTADSHVEAFDGDHSVTIIDFKPYEI